MIFDSQVSLRVHYCKRDEIASTSQHSSDKQWTPKWPYIANTVFQIFKIMVEKVTFVGFTVGDRPPWNRPCVLRHRNIGRAGRGSKKLRAMETYEKQRKCYPIMLATVQQQC